MSEISLLSQQCGAKFRRKGLVIHGALGAITLRINYCKARDGTEINMVATATDIARRGPDALWRR